MSTDEQAWQEWLDDNRTIAFAFPLEDGGHELRLAFMAGYRRALEDAADQSTDTDAMDYWVGILSEERQWAGVADWLRDRAAGVGTKDGDDDA